MAEPIADASTLFFPPLQPAADATLLSGGGVFLAESRDGPDGLEVTEAIRPIAELCAHRQTQTPLVLGVVGRAGAGKSFALERLAGLVGEFAASGARAAGGPFVARMVTARLDAASMPDEPATAIAAAVFSALGRDHGEGDYAALADEAAHASADPHVAANKALERHDEARRRLDAERQARDDVEARRARLVETVLFDTAGSRIDAFARSARGRVEARLRRFDLTGADAMVSYKTLVREFAEAGWGGRIAVALGAIWAYRSQRRLLMAALTLFILAFGAAELQTPRALAGLRGLGPPFIAAADWLAGQSDLVGDAVVVLGLLGALALVVDLWRALFFVLMLFRGARLLTYDVRERGRDLDAASARLNRRVVALSAEAEAAARRAEAAERRASGRGAAGATRAPTPSFMDSAHSGPASARAFLAALGGLIAAHASRDPFVEPQGAQPSRALLGPSPAPAPAPTLAAPERLLLLVDNLDALAPARALELLETLHFLCGESFVAAVACDPLALAPAVGGLDALRGRLDKLFQLTFDASPADSAAGARLMARLTGGAPPRPLEPAARTPLAEPLSAAEATLLAELAPLAAATPRGVKRLLNAYRVARTGNANRAALALMLALGQSGDREALAAIEERLAASRGELTAPDGPPAVAAAVRAAAKANGGDLTVADAVAARAVARRFQLFA